MKIVSAATTLPESRPAGQELAGRTRADLGDLSADVAFIFLSSHYSLRAEELVATIAETLEPRYLLGVSAETVVQGAIEYEQQHAAALWTAHLPNVNFCSFHLSQSDLEQCDAGEALRDHLRVDPADQPSFMLLGDPFTVDISTLLDRFGQAYPQRPAIGGLASSGSAAGENILVFDGQVLHHGLSGIAFWGDVSLGTVVSQGCRPIGRHAVITDGEHNVIKRLGGHPPLQVVHDLFDACDAHDQDLLRSNGLFVGRVINEYQPKFTRGDFLIRNPIGFDRESGAMALNDRVRTGQTVQFHVRDAAAADEDLHTLLAASRIAQSSGALLFTCTGRGSHLFDQPNHDAAAIAAHAPNLPLAGLFCGGEIGPIGRANHIHGHTAAIGYFSPADRCGDAG